MASPIEELTGVTNVVAICPVSKYERIFTVKKGRIVVIFVNCCWWVMAGWEEERNE